jgi:hypothetical protein
MQSYYPVICCRSDGKTKVLTRNGSTELNQPTEKQFKDTPDAQGHVDCYRKLDDTAEKSLDWRRKLGGMLRDVLDAKNSMFDKIVSLGTATNKAQKRTTS